ncbi:PD-(D/E)XK nuclease family protein [Paraburkholderia gardini]|uniref:PD-(D/E)XK nuclease family protein n=1 Tax=Paraburkholderia gardini TaxID=2823469 RepID=UPI001DF4568E|nr:PD-(D/E)XK nuclease family protein [Paraburkholderia gardini]CAG4913859.1 hypothetical protein R69919_04138 [Paraburkholderia gardini]
MSEGPQTLPADQFGNFLASVAERDVDLLLMEEFHANDDFVSWFCSKLQLTQVRADGAWHSVSDADGESDLIVRVLADGRRIGVFIENKIAAPEQFNQAARYHLRAVRSQERGQIDTYVTVMCAPQRYLSSLRESSEYQFRVSYEEIAEWFGIQPDRRSAWRRQVMQDAIEQSRRGYQVVPHPGNTAFHYAYWQNIHSNHPRIVMRQPSVRGKNSNWIVLKGRDSDKNNVQIDHLLRDGIVRLSLFGRTVDEVKATRPDWPEDIQLVSKPKSAVLAIAVPPIDMEAAYDAQRHAVEVALDAVYRLLPFATAFKT